MLLATSQSCWRLLVPSPTMPQFQPAACDKRAAPPRKHPTKTPPNNQPVKTAIMATNSVHPTEGDLAVVIKWLQEESATSMQGAKTSVAPNTVAATIVNADSAVDPTTTDIATAPVDGAASRKRQRSESTSSHSAEDFDDAKTVETSVTEGDEREEDDEDEEYEEDEDCNCSRCVPPPKKRTHRAGRGSASPQRKTNLNPPP